MMEPISFEDAEIEVYEKPWALTGTKCERKHNVVNSLYLKADELEAKNFQRFERYKQVEENEAMWEEYMMEDAEICVVAFGIASRVAKNAIVAARKEGIKVGLIRPITLWPFPRKAIAAAADKVKGFISVELSMGQMIEDVRLYSECKKPVALCNRCGGMIPSPDEVLTSIRKAQKGEF
jgi:2-oxoglutarate ferredoxin oxidoreductase subunit alpha